MHGDDDSVDHVSGVHTAGFPLNLGHIDFDATVGETLHLTTQLTAAASIDGIGSADADMFGSYSARIFDPLSRGYDITFSVEPLPVPELPVSAMFAAGLGALALVGARRHRDSPSGLVSTTSATRSAATSE